MPGQEIDIQGLPINLTSGGYQPAQKWLKDRKGRDLEFDDILHNQKIIVVFQRRVG